MRSMCSTYERSPITITMARIHVLTVTLAKSEDDERQKALEQEIRGMRAKSAAQSAQLQKQVMCVDKANLGGRVGCNVAD